jgi:hypothetical protein
MLMFQDQKIGSLFSTPKYEILTMLQPQYGHKSATFFLCKGIVAHGAEERTGCNFQLSNKMKAVTKSI